MKNNKNRPNKCRYRKIVIIALLLLLLLILIIVISTSNKKINKIALGENALEIGGEEIDISEVITTDPNPPVIGAGMIPIKWNEEEQKWQITTVKDKEWYNYSNGKWANVMLSDGYYKSELQRNITKNQLAENNLGTLIERQQDLGSIYTWVPRLTYLEDRVEYLKGTSILEYMWTTEKCFNLEGYGIDSLDLAFTGIWVGQKEYKDLDTVENKNNSMNSEENSEGLIANEMVTTITDSEIKAAKQLYKKTVGNGTHAISNKSIVQNIDSMEYRQVIRIINTNNKLPIVVYHVVAGESIIIKDRYVENGLKFVADKDGNKLERNTAKFDQDEIIYTFYIVDGQGNIRKYKMNYGVGRPYLKGFNKSATYYVTYDKNGNEDSSIPIGESAPEDWYNYENQQWANIVVRNAGNETYYTWIPRYMYKINDDGSETVDAKFVDLENIWTDPVTKREVNLTNSEYKLPEAFTWEDPENPEETMQLTGFWASKYKLREGSSYNPEISSGGQKIIVRNVVSTIGSSYKYEMYLVKDGKRIIWDNETSSYIQGTKPISLTSNNYTFSNLEPGIYSVNIIVKDSSGNFVRGVGQNIVILEPTMEEPDLTGFNENLTFYVAYDANGNESSYIPIKDAPPDGWYDYESQKWANIVVRDNGKENYYVWIPRYEYKLDTANEKTNVQFIRANKETADSGYQIPEAFTWEDPNDSSKTIQLKGFWSAKYKLRATSGTTSRLIATVNASESEVKVSGYVATNTSKKYNVYLIKDGKIVGRSSTTTAGECRIAITEAGNYSIEVTQIGASGEVVAGYAYEFVVYKADPPDLTGFKLDTTYIVTYNASGVENHSLTLRRVLKDGYEEQNGALVKGEVDLSKITTGTWYDYSLQKWANIMTLNDNTTNYFTWIPRYQYKIVDTENQRVNATLIPKTKVEPDIGYQIPEAFTWEDPNDSNKTIQLSGFWAGKYKLRSTE